MCCFSVGRDAQMLSPPHMLSALCCQVLSASRRVACMRFASSGGDARLLDLMSASCNLQSRDADMLQHAFLDAGSLSRTVESPIIRRPSSHYLSVCSMCMRQSGSGDYGKRSTLRVLSLLQDEGLEGAEARRDCWKHNEISNGNYYSIIGYIYIHIYTYITLDWHSSC